MAGDGLGDEAIAVGAAVEVGGFAEAEGLLGVGLEESMELGKAGHRSAGGDGRSVGLM